VSVYYKGVLIATWDATTSGGNKVSNGTYLLKVTSTDPFGITTSVTNNVTVDIPRSVLTIVVYNEAGEAVKTFSMAELENLLGGALQSDDYDVGQSKESPKLITPSYSNPMGNGNYATITLGSGRSFNWEGRGDNGRILSSGRYFIEIAANETHWGKQQMLIPITLQDLDTNAISGVVLAPNPININQTSQARFLIGTNMGQVDGAKVKIYTIAGELRQLLTNDPGNPTQVTWDLGQSNPASGTYIAVVELYSGGGIVGRQKLKAFVLH
jgi:flagellar hook assembly protein FlgD